MCFYRHSILQVLTGPLHIHLGNGQTLMFEEDRDLQLLDSTEERYQEDFILETENLKADLVEAQVRVHSNLKLVHLQLALENVAEDLKKRVQENDQFTTLEQRQRAIEEGNTLLNRCKCGMSVPYPRSGKG